MIQFQIFVTILWLFIFQLIVIFEGRNLINPRRSRVWKRVSVLIKIFRSRERRTLGFWRWRTSDPARDGFSALSFELRLKIDWQTLWNLTRVISGSLGEHLRRFSCSCSRCLHGARKSASRTRKSESRVPQHRPGPFRLGGRPVAERE